MLVGGGGDISLKGLKYVTLVMIQVDVKQTCWLKKCKDILSYQLFKTELKCKSRSVRN